MFQWQNQSILSPAPSTVDTGLGSNPGLGSKLSKMAYMFEGIQAPPIPDGWWYHGLRLALQPVLVWWALFCANGTDWPWRRPKR
jgi:hypothetical protein